MNKILYILRSIKWYFTYCGNTFYCSLCKRSARSFVQRNKKTIGQGTIDEYDIVAMGNRKHYACPWCFSSDKERLVWWYLSQILVPGQCILHIAPEKNTQRRIQQLSNIEYVCGDKFYDNPRYNDGRYDGADIIDITALPYADSSFDIIICNHVLEHIEDDTRALSELYRVLRIGGKAILQVPISYITETIEDNTIKTEEDRERRFGQIDHVRIYGTDYPARVEKAGFKVTDISPRNRPSLMRFCVNSREHIYVAERTSVL